MPLAFVVERLLASDSRHAALPGILQVAANVAAQAQRADQARYFHARLQERFPDSEAARQVAAHAAV